MSKSKIGSVYIILGVELLVVSLAAAKIWIGNVTGLEWKQALGAVIGGLFALGGLRLGRNKSSQQK